MAKENDRIFEEKYQKKYEKIARKQERKRFKTDKYIKGVSNEVSNNSNNMQKKLSVQEKQAMFAEYEKIITVLKELELRNKKGEKFNYKFKNLQYFKSLNGHSIYSNALSEQEQKDKASISAMMAYSQIEGGLSVSLDKVMVYIRPERKDEFLSACKNNPYLSRNLVGMSKVVQYIKQKDYTRAYASVVYFGLEDKLDFIETFFKVGFNSDFKKQITDFKATIANISDYDAQAIRDEAHTVVTSQHDAMTTAMKMSATGKSALNVMASNAINDFDIVKNKIQSDNISNEKSSIQEILNEAIISAKLFNEIKQQHGGNIRAVRDNIINGKNIAYKNGISIKTKKNKTTARYKYSSVAKTDDGKVNAGGVMVSSSASKGHSDITTSREELRVKSEEISKLQNIEQIEIYSKEIENLAEKIKNAKTPEEAAVYIEQRKVFEDAQKRAIAGSGQNLTDDNINRQINTIEQKQDEKKAKLQRTNSESEQQKLIQEIDELESELNALQEKQESQNIELTNAINETKEELASINAKMTKLNRDLVATQDDESRQQIREQLEVLHEQQVKLQEKLQELISNSKGNGFDDLLVEYSHDGKTLSKVLKEMQDKVKQLSATPELRKENKDIIAKCENKIKRLEEQINLIKENQKEISMIGMCDQYDAMLKILMSKDTISGEDLKQIKKCVRKVEDFNKITGENLTQNEFNNLEKSGKQFTIVDRQLFNKKLMGNMTCLYTRMLSTSGKIDENEIMQLTSIRDARVAQIEKAIEDMQNEIDSMKKTIENGGASGWESEIQENIAKNEAVLEALNKMKQTIEEKFVEKTGIVIDKVKDTKTVTAEQIEAPEKQAPEQQPSVETENESEQNNQKDDLENQTEVDSKKVFSELNKKVESQFEYTESEVEANNKASQNAESQAVRVGSDQLTEEYVEGSPENTNGKSNVSVKVNVNA